MYFDSIQEITNKYTVPNSNSSVLYKLAIHGDNITEQFLLFFLVKRLSVAHST